MRSAGIVHVICGEVDLGPAGAEQLAQARRGDDAEFQRPRGDAAISLQLARAVNAGTWANSARRDAACSMRARLGNSCSR